MTTYFMLKYTFMFILLYFHENILITLLTSSLQYIKYTDMKREAVNGVK